MKTILILLAFILTGCHETGAPVKKDEKKTRPAPRWDRPRRMQASSVKVVAVIDTGFGVSGEEPSDKLCKTGHKNFTKDFRFKTYPGIKDPVPADDHGHGTNIAGVIYDYAGSDTEYCMVILKYYSVKTGRMEDNLKNTVAAIKYATEIGADYINYSGGGPERNDEEVVAVKAFLDAGGQFIAAAGNESKDLSKTPYYPAMDDLRVVVVGNLDRAGKPAKSSNYGRPVKIWETGTNVVGFGLNMSGTSQAAAVTTGKMLRLKK